MAILRSIAPEPIIEIPTETVSAETAPVIYDYSIAPDKNKLETLDAIMYAIIKANQSNPTEIQINQKFKSLIELIRKK